MNVNGAVLEKKDLGDVGYVRIPCIRVLNLETIDYSMEARKIISKMEK